MTDEELNEKATAEHADFVASEDQAELRSEIERLRTLIAYAECRGAGPYAMPSNCPWCGYTPGAYKRSHAPECAAFTENREVRRR